MNVPGAEIAVDDKVVGKSPLGEPVPLNPGRRKISAKKEGRLPDAKVIEVASADKTTVALNLAPGKETIVKTGTDWKPVVAWIVTGGFAVGASVMSYPTLSASSDLKDQKEALGGVRAADAEAKRVQLDDQHTKMRTFSIVSDVLWGGTAVAGAFAIYFTWLAPKESTETKPRSGSVRFSPTLGAANLVGTF